MSHFSLPLWTARIQCQIPVCGACCTSSLQPLPAASTLVFPSFWKQLMELVIWQALLPLALSGVGNCRVWLCLVNFLQFAISWSCWNLPTTLVAASSYTGWTITGTSWCLGARKPMPQQLMADVPDADVLDTPVSSLYEALCAPKVPLLQQVQSRTTD